MPSTLFDAPNSIVWQNTRHLRSERRSVPGITSDRQISFVEIGRKVYPFEDRVPKWACPFLRRINTLLTLPENWDAYDAKPLDPALANAAFNLLLLVMPTDAPAPAISPSPTGGLLLSWRQSGIELEIDVEAASRFEVTFENLKTGKSWSDVLSSDMQPLVDALSHLT